MSQHNNTSGTEHNKGSKHEGKTDTNNAKGLEQYAHLRITDTSEYPPPVPVVTIEGHIICTEGNITTISGASKSGKSAFTGFLLAGALSEDGILEDPLYPLKVEPNSRRKAVLHIDTEQAKHKHQSNIIGIVRRAAYEYMPDWFLSYNIRELQIPEYKKVTSGICAAAAVQFGGIHLIVIDGIADFIKDVNDQEQSNEIVKYFEDLAILYKTPIVVIIHTNPSGDKERGHLGSQCQRKSESVLLIRQEDDISIVEAKFLRMAGKGNIPKLQFIYDETRAYHITCGVSYSRTQDKDEERLKLLEKIAAEVFANDVQLRDGEAQEKVQKTTGKGIGTSKGYLKDMRAHRIITKGMNGLWRLNPDYVL